MKKQLVALATVITLAVPLPTISLAHEKVKENNKNMIQYWSVEDKHLEGINSHLWIV
ncbi:phospholipase, partial [Bacillus anthracis]